MYKYCIVSKTVNAERTAALVFRYRKILSGLGSSQFRIQYQSYMFHLIWNQNGAEMESN